GQAVEIVPNGIDCSPYLRYNRAAPEPGAPLRLIYVGRLVAGKGLLETIEGLRLARSRGIDARLVIAGNGPEEPRLRQYTRDAESIAEAIAALAADRARLTRMSAACRKHIATAYSIERVARDFSQLYWGVCAARAPRTAL